jgi:hypothetical protein
VSDNTRRGVEQRAAVLDRHDRVVLAVQSGERPTGTVVVLPGQRR